MNKRHTTKIKSMHKDIMRYTAVLSELQEPVHAHDTGVTRIDAYPVGTHTHTHTHTQRERERERRGVLPRRKILTEKAEHDHEADSRSYHIHDRASALMFIAIAPIYGKPISVMTNRSHMGESIYARDGRKSPTTPNQAPVSGVSE